MPWNDITIHIFLPAIVNNGRTSKILKNILYQCHRSRTDLQILVNLDLIVIDWR